MCYSDSNSHVEPLVSSEALEALLSRYRDHLQAEGITEPLAQSFTLATVMYDLCQLAEVPPPPTVVALVGEG